MRLAGQDRANVGTAKLLLYPVCEKQRYTVDINKASHKEKCYRFHSDRRPLGLKFLHHFLDNLVMLPFSMYLVSSSESLKLLSNKGEIILNVILSEHPEVFVLSL